MTPTLETQRIILKPASLDDCAELQPLFAHWDVVRYLNFRVPWPYPHDGVLTFTRDTLLPKVASGASQAWTLFEKSSGKAMGRIELRTVPAEGDQSSRGFWIGRPFQRQGYMTEAAERVTQYAFEEIGLPYLIFQNAIENEPSSRIKRSAGAELVDIRDCVNPKGEPGKKEVWRLTREAWLSRRAAP